ncbi:MAG: hypothetical protein ACOH5I_26465 [Oligoflexus sp.]
MPAILAGIGNTLLAMLTAALTGPVVKRLVANYLLAEAKRYQIRAEKTEDKQDDARAEMFIEQVAALREAWGLKNER